MRMHIQPSARAVTFLSVAIALLLAAALPSNGSAAELLMATRENCPYCEAWEIQVGSVYEKTAESRIAPLRRVHISEFSSLPYIAKEPVRHTPTFILFERDVEIGRIVGYSDEATFWGLLKELLNRMEQDRLNSIQNLRKADHKF